MVQRKELPVENDGRRRASKILPVGSDGTVHTDSSLYAGRQQAREQVGVPPVEPEVVEPEVVPDEEATWQPREEDIVDAEVVDEMPASGQESQEKVRDRARSFFGGRTKAKTDKRERQRETDATRAASDDEGLTDRERLLKLRSEVRQSGETYMTSLKDSNFFVPGIMDEPAEQDKKMDAMHQVYIQMMMQGCMRPLSRGVNSSSVLQVVGTMTALTLLSKDFRDQVGEYAEPIKAKIKDRIDDRTRSVRDSAQGDADRHNKLVDAGTEARLGRNPALADDEKFAAGREGKKRDRGDFLSKRWQRRMDKMEHRERGNRQMFTPESAAMTEVALMENAFWKMRDPETDSGEIHTSYRAMRSRLREQMAEDGLDRSEVVAKAWTIIGERMEDEPELKLMFNGVAQGRYVKAPPHGERIAGTDKVRSVWRGEFLDDKGAQVPEGAMFTLRRPMSPAEHQVAMAEAMAGPIKHAQSRGDRAAFVGNMQGYLVGFAAKQKGFDASTVPPGLRKPLEQSEMMLASMDVDGLSPETQREVYSNAFGDAMEELVKDSPDFEHDLRLTMGEDWLSRLKAATDEPERFLFEQRMRTQAYPAGPADRDRSSQPQDEQANSEDYQPA